MTANDFRRLALSLPEATEGAHMDHPDFRVGGKIFATLWPQEDCGVVLVSPEQQAELIDAAPDVFMPVPGGWGRRGSTQVLLPVANETIVRDALRIAWQKRAPRRLLKA